MSSDAPPTPPSPAAPTTDADRYVVGRDPHGRWVAIEIHGRAGGLFTSRHAAIHYAEGETGRRVDAVLVSGEPVELRL